mgnify:CR=1 FL=1
MFPKYPPMPTKKHKHLSYPYHIHANNTHTFLADTCKLPHTLAHAHNKGKPPMNILQLKIFARMPTKFQDLPPSIIKATYLPCCLALDDSHQIEQCGVCVCI